MRTDSDDGKPLIVGRPVNASAASPHPKAKQCKCVHCGGLMWYSLITFMHAVETHAGTGVTFVCEKCVREFTGGDMELILPSDGTLREMSESTGKTVGELRAKYESLGFKPL